MVFHFNFHRCINSSQPKRFYRRALLVLMGCMMMLAVLFISSPPVTARVSLSWHPGITASLHGIEIAQAPRIGQPPQKVVPPSPAPNQTKTAEPAEPSAAEAQPAPNSNACSNKRFADDLVAFLLRFGFLLIVVGGALGGLIYGITQHHGAVMPHQISLMEGEDLRKYVKWNLGFFQDMLVGIGGGLIVFGLIPQVGNNTLFEELLKDCPSMGTAAETLVKIISLSLIGGFAGISLFSEAAKRINMQVVDQIKAQTNAQGQLITAIKEGNAQESEVRLILNRVVDPSIDISPSEAERLRQAILKSPIQVRNIVFERSQQSLQTNRILGVSDLLGTPEIQAKLAQLDSLLPVFNDLEDAARQENPAFNGVNVNGSHGDINLHRYVAHQGFVHKQLAIGHSLLGEAGQASQDLIDADRLLTEAITLRDAPRSEAITREFWHYGLDRAFCRFRRGLLPQAQEDLTTPQARFWGKTLDPGVVATNLKGFIPPHLRPEVQPTDIIRNDFIDWVATILPGFVPSDFLTRTPNLPTEATGNGHLQGQRDQEDFVRPLTDADPDHGA
jgi:hypothetical protein